MTNVQAQMRNSGDLNLNDTTSVKLMTPVNNVKGQDKYVFGAVDKDSALQLMQKHDELLEEKTKLEEKLKILQDDYENDTKKYLDAKTYKTYGAVGAGLGAFPGALMVGMGGTVMTGTLSVETFLLGLGGIIGGAACVVAGAAIGLGVAAVVNYFRSGNKYKEQLPTLIKETKEQIKALEEEMVIYRPQLA